TARFDAHRLSRRDLNVIDVVAIPDRLQDAVGKTERQNVLNRFLAQVVIDPVNLFLLKKLLDVRIQGTGRLEVASEGFLDDHTAPLAVVLGGQPDTAQLMNTA